MDNYESFKKFITDAGLHYAEGKLEKGDRVFRIPQQIKNGGVVDVLVVFGQNNIKVVFLGIGKVDSDEKRNACYKLFNDLSAQFNFFKFYVRQDGDIGLEGDVVLGIIEGEFQPKALMGFMAAAITLLQDNYGDIMKILQS